jgi:hypothetical protein
MLASWLGFESAKTTATVAGNAAGIAASITAGFGQIQIDAAVAAAGAMAAISAIPFVGPALAPAVAAETYATTLAWASGLGAALVSAEGGMWQVPGDTLANIHKDESVIPANVANPMRDFFEGGAGGGIGDTHFHGPLVQVSGAAAADPNAIAAAVARAVRDFHPAFRQTRL